MPFICSICGEESTRICVRCTKDACANHLCDKCLRCSDCCECEVALSEEIPGPPLGSARAAIRAAAAESHPPFPDPEPDPPGPEPFPPGPDPDPDPIAGPPPPGPFDA